MNYEKLRLILDAWRQAELDGRPRESEQSAGSTYLRERLQVVAERCCRDFPGDLVEIGCLNGSTTVRLCAVAREHGRRVIAIDPWQVGQQEIIGGEYERFLQATEPYKDLLDVWRMDSTTAKCIIGLRARELAFAFVDGLHTYEACRSDIQACYQSPLVVVDDWTWSQEIRLAITEMQGGRRLIMEQPFHEAYII